MFALLRQRNFGLLWFASGGATELGWLMSAQAVGGIAGGLLIGQIGKRIAPLRLIAISGLLDGALLFGIVNGGSLVLALILMGCRSSASSSACRRSCSNRPRTAIAAGSSGPSVRRRR